ncbi:MAG: hypothetical protein MUP47_03240, partial [Phycisphaerae bacterium]|nr:hypothetical protein [Phycisphaerae bacterium]
MTLRQSHWLEKLTVQVAVVASLIAGYFLLYPLVRASDGRMAVAFLATGGLDRAATFMAGLLVLSIACGLLTFSARPCGTILVAVLGAGAVALRSPEFRTLLWLRQDHYGGLFRLLMAEMLLLAVALGIAVLVIGWVRALAAKVAPPLAWRPTETASASARAKTG